MSDANSQSECVPERPRLKIASFNIRFDALALGQERKTSTSLDEVCSAVKSTHTATAGTSTESERPWSEKKYPIADLVKWEEPDVIGFQEPLKNQVKDLEELLRPCYGWVGVGREDGVDKGEFVPIFYRKDKFEVASVYHFWLSETPDIPNSIGWDADQTRLATLSKFRFLPPPSAPLTPSAPPPSLATTNDAIPDPLTSSLDPSSKSRQIYGGIDEFWVLNTHYDDKGVVARAKSSEVILDRIENLVRGDEENNLDRREPRLVVVMGDLNSQPGSEGYQVLTGGRYQDTSSSTSIPVKKEGNLSFLDTRHELRLRPASSRPHELNLLNSPFPQSRLETFTGFSTSQAWEIKDYMFVAHNGILERPGGGEEKGERVLEGWQVTRYGIVSNLVEGWGRMSDHRMVAVVFEKV